MGAAAWVSERERVYVWVAAVRAPGQEGSEVYFAEARIMNPDNAIVIVLSDPEEPTEDAPFTAIKLVVSAGFN
mgnify:CR=1 FL=1